MNAFSIELGGFVSSADSPRWVHVWDMPVRVTHWLFVLCIAVSWWTAEQRYMTWHRYSGYLLLGLLVFRLYWGLVGSSTARFAQFVRGPRTVLDYLRRGRATPKESPGHTPLGALSVVAMLGLMLAQVLLGLFVTDIDGLESGPLSHWVSFDMGRTLAGFHETVFNVLLGLIALHVVAILFYLFYRRDDLISAMWSGRKRTSEPHPALSRVPPWRIAPGVGLAGLIVWLVVR